MSDQNRITPRDLFDVLDAQYEFDIDCAATAKNALCGQFISLKDTPRPEYRDALNPKTRWIRQQHRRAFCNPPWSNPPLWLEKAHSEAQRHADAVVVVLLPTGSGRKREPWRQKASLIVHLIGRPMFVSKSGGSNSSNMHDVTLYVYRRKLWDYPPQTIYLAWTGKFPKGFV